MKRVLYLFFICPILAFGQNKIDGIGQFRIGKTSSAIIDQIALEKRVKVKKSGSMRDLFLAEANSSKKTKNIFILVEGAKGDIEHPEYSHDPNVKIYYIDYYEISSVPISKIYLFFYKDTLYSIHTDGSSEIDDAMTTKYGPAKKTTETKKVSCVNRTAGNFELEEKAFTSEWDTGIDSIKVVSYLKKYYNSNCAEQYMSYFYIDNELLSHKIQSSELEYSSKKNSEEATEKKKTLSEF